MSDQELREAEREVAGAVAARRYAAAHPQAWWLDRTGEQA